MKNRNKIILIFLSCAFITLAVCDLYIQRVRNDSKYSSAASVLKQTNDMHKNFSYSDIIKTLDTCSPKFVLLKIEKNNKNKNFINTEVKYDGELGELIKGLKIMKMQEITKGINEINIGKTENKEYIAEINVDFLTFK